MDKNYKLVHSVDPTKCRPKFREKFSKLTLSSNKKREEEAKAQHQQARDQAMQSNVSRNLLSELLTDDESDGEKEQPQNLLLRTDSSPSDGNTAAKRRTLNSTDATHCSEVDQDREKSLDMEPLLVSGIENTEAQPNIDDVIEKLSSRVSSLAMGGATIHLSSETVPHELSQIVSTESHKMRSGQRLSDLLRPKCDKQPEVLVSISSSSSESEESIICLSDSSEDEHEVNVSNSLASGVGLSQTSDLVKADRMAAFLRDVRRNYGLPIDSSSSQAQDYENRQKAIACADTEPMTIDNDSRSAGTAARIATADTESMTPEKETTERESNETQKDASNKRLALNDTEDMTNLSESMQSLPHYAPVMNVASQLLDVSLHKSCGSIPDDSLTIAETSEEEQEYHRKGGKKDRSREEEKNTSKEKDRNNEEECDQSNEESATQGALRPSASLSQLRSKESSVSSGQDTQFHINISAKINIKIQVSQQMDDSTSTEGSYTSTNSSPSNGKSEVDSSLEKPQSSAQKAKSQTSALEDRPHSPPERDVTPKSPEKTNISPDRFLESAHRLLNELYGNSWKTPDVMRSLKKSVHPVVKSVELPKPNECNLKPPISQSPREHELESKNESALDDFSIFRRNIPQDLDSTRLPSTPVTASKEPRTTKTLRRPRKIDEVVSPQIDVTKSEGDRMGELEVDSDKWQKRVSPAKTPQVELTHTKCGRTIRRRCRTVVDSDIESEGENASDKSWSMSDKDDVENKEPTVLRRRVRPARTANTDKLVYLDLTKGEVEVQQTISATPPANNDEKFSRRLDEILNSCKFRDKSKIECTPAGGTKTKRKLFTANLIDDDENLMPAFDSPKERLQNIDKDDERVTMSGALMPAKFEPFNKHLESVKLGKPIFKIQTPKAKRDGRQCSADEPKTPKSVTKELKVIGSLSATPRDTYGFLKSLDLCVGRSLCHPDALYYRDNFRLKKDELANKLYEIYNQKCFSQELDVPIKWNKKLTNTAGRCMNKKRLGERTCCIELSEKVLTSADRLRCTLIHELCHAATWIFTGEGGHGATWKAWARKANQVFPELPAIGVCHQYDIEYKYTYKCTLCGAKSHAHSKSKKVDNIRCSYCHGAIEVYLNKKDKDGSTISTPVREPTGFAKFVKDKYKEYKRPDLKHADVMKLLSNEFASMKVDTKS